MSLTPGATLGPYTITADLGHGGMGVVYTARTLTLDGLTVGKAIRQPGGGLAHGKAAHQFSEGSREN